VPAELVAAKEADEKEVDTELAGREVELARQQAASEERRATAELKSLADRRHRARARVAQLEEDILRMRVTAPRRGTVLYNQEGGERPKVGDSVWQGRIVLTIPDLASLRGEGQVDETDFAALAVGQQARLILDAFPDQPYTAEVRAIGSSLRFREEGTREKVVQVDLSLPSAGGGQARPGMRFRGQVIVARVEGVLLLSIEAVRTTTDGPMALARRWLGTAPAALKLGRQVGGKVEILSGLAEGTEVLLP
jgi:Cu(I)/Ag(I) efflux system membrane fusion protein